VKKMLVVPILATVLAAQTSFAGVNVNVNLGAPVAVPVPVVPAPVAPPPAEFYVEEPPEFIIPSALGFYVAVGVPYDLFYVGNVYYVYRNNTWYRGPSYNGPWAVTSYRRLPPGLRRHKFERIRYYRDEEYRHYRDDRDHYRGRYFRPDRHEAKERRKEEHERAKEERRWEKDERKWEKQERKMDREEQKRHKHGRDDD
jgi:hypothetical protein